MNLAAIEKEGYAAFESGIERRKNPYYESSNMPHWNNKTIDAWQSEVAAWEAGWDAAQAKSAGLRAFQINDSKSLV